MTAMMDKVRFSIGDARIWQGYHRKGESGMVGSSVWLTADTLRRVTDSLYANMTTDFDRTHNAPEPEWDLLAFGGAVWYVEPGRVRLAPDGHTVLYPLTMYEAIIVQRFDPNGGRTYDRHGENGVITKVPMGVWVNEEVLDGDIGPVEWDPLPQGFILDKQLWDEGRSDTPPVRMLRDEEEGDVGLTVEQAQSIGVENTTTLDQLDEEQKSNLADYEDALTGDSEALYSIGVFHGRQGIEPMFESEQYRSAWEEGQAERRGVVAAKVARVTIEYVDGLTAEMEFSSNEHDSGTTYRGSNPDSLIAATSRYGMGASHERSAYQALEDAISAAVTEGGLWPTK